MRIKTRSVALLTVLAIAFISHSGSASAESSPSRLNERGIIVNYTEFIPELPKAKVRSYIIVDLNTGSVLAAKNPQLQLPPASTLKALTALTLLGQLDPNRSYRARRADARIYGSEVGIVQGRKYTIDQLWYGLLLPSGNDAALALANANGGITKTIAQMNETAKLLGAQNTVAKTPHGLDTPGQVTTAYDLALIGQAAIANAEYRRYSRTTRYVFPNVGRSNTPVEIANTNRLLYSYPGLIAGKTGYTTQAKSCYLGAARKSGQQILITFLGAESSRDPLAASLFGWGFAVAGFIEPIGKLGE
jgi:D-alanyl-D-alanine carboxypeptidase (penicillin-binding protein 5/6)